MAPLAGNSSQTASAAQAFIQLWGDMGPRWGVPRTLTLVHALLFIEGRPLNTDDVMARLGISRGNASMTLRTLVEWGLAARTHNPTDRKDYFASDQDVWGLFVTVTRARRRREMEPLMSALASIVDAPESGGDDAARTKLADMLRFVRAFDAVSERVLALGPQALEAFSQPS